MKEFLPREQNWVLDRVGGLHNAGAKGLQHLLRMSDCSVPPFHSFFDQEFLIAILAPASLQYIGWGWDGEKITPSFSSLVAMLRRVTSALMERSGL